MDEQLLLNIVRLRYRDTPSFLEISSISTSFDFNASLGAEAQLRQGAGNILNLRPSIGRTERPTITYLPMRGESFARNLLAPVGLESLVYLSQSGWSAERILRVCVQRMNGVLNAPTASGPTPDREPEWQEYRELARLLRRLQQADAVFILPPSAEQKERGARGLLAFTPAGADSEEGRRFKAMLGLRADGVEFPLFPGLVAPDADTIAVSTRSLLSVLFFLSHGIDLPEQALDSGAVTQTLGRTGTPFDWQQTVMEDLFRIRSSPTEPKDHTIRTRYRGHWFYLAEQDLDSKSTFLMTDLLLAIQSGDRAALAPILTLPVSR
ncbi:MAG: hypothetical protein EA425_15785 [Puniceicoccaceae bacterium]|nr:MAG: hypothetical protein EA425_15785 [Puniceicoccaceae bacterium]